MVDPLVYDCETCQKRGTGKQVNRQNIEEGKPTSEINNLTSYYSSKVQRVIELAAEILANGEKCIIFTMWIHVMEQLASRLMDFGFRVVALHSKVKKDVK